MNCQPKQKKRKNKLCDLLANESFWVGIGRALSQNIFFVGLYDSNCFHSSSALYSISISQFLLFRCSFDEIRRCVSVCVSRVVACLFRFGENFLAYFWLVQKCLCRDLLSALNEYTSFCYSQKYTPSTIPFRFRHWLLLGFHAWMALVGVFGWCSWPGRCR